MVLAPPHSEDWAVALNGSFVPNGIVDCASGNRTTGIPASFTRTVTGSEVFEASRTPMRTATDLAPEPSAVGRLKMGPLAPDTGWPLTIHW